VLLRQFNLYDLFIVAFAQLILTTVLVLSPAREFDTRFRWTGSKITEVLLGALGAVAISALACFVTYEVWAKPVGGLETAAYLLAIFGVVVIVLRPDTGVVGSVFHASYLASGFTYIAFAADVAASATHSIAEALTTSLLLLLDLAAFIVWGSNVNYVSDVLCRRRHTRPLPAADPSYMPMVSLHIPAYNEPPDLLIKTIEAAEAIDYPNFEVIVIDNNTSDPAVYGPVEEYCRGRERVRFVHVAPWPGYKAGACNLALRSYTDPRAEIIGLIDADDIVQPYYLKETVPYFSDPHLGFLQSFEGNRDYEGSGYYSACVDSYQGFYLSVMSSRNERDSVPFVGTMGLFRRSALDGIGGWNEWCISEDTEASLRMSKAGWSGLYIPRCFGRGVVPPTYAGLNTQRHRWCFGAMQIFRLHWRSLLPWDRSPDNHLTGGQRRDYLMACLGWWRDPLMFGFAVLLLVITGLRLSGSHFALMPLGGDRSLLPMSLILIASICMMWTLRYWTTMSHRRTLLGLLISLSATWITALACMEGLTRRDGVFLRTLKTGGSRQRLRTALRLSRVETLLTIALFTSAGLLAASAHPPWLLIVIVVVQGTVYSCAPIASLWNQRAQRLPALTYRQRFEQRRLREARRGRPRIRVLGPAAAVLLAVGAGGVTGAFVAPSTLLRASAVDQRTVFHSSASTGVFLKLGALSSKQASYFPVTSVKLSQPLSPSRKSPGRLSLSFETSSLNLLDAVFRDEGPRRGIPALTLVARKLNRSGRLATTEAADTFYGAVVTSFHENLSGPPTGEVTLLLSVLGHLLTSPKDVGGIGVFTQTPGSAPAATFVKVGSAFARDRSYPVSSVELYQPVSSSTRSPAGFEMSFETSSLTLLDLVLREGTPGRGIPALTLVVRSSGRNARLITTETLYKAVVASFDENLSGSVAGEVVLSTR
jgi:cellulose synthase/poly-beta-1,6-N-acetylglucosamine synthase-like glycosyltransferase